MAPGFARCSQCRYVCRAEIHADGEITPVGIAECPRCESEAWREFDGE